MASLVFGLAGAAIGAPFAGFLGMSGASLGWTIGSMVGGMLFAPKQPTQYGPRLGDLKVQASTYGNPIPMGWGNFRVAGNVIWSTPKIETSHSQTSGGKGGGGGVTQVSYTYSQSFAVAVHDGEITGIRKIWANGKLIYNLSDTADLATIIASNRSAAGIRIYTGSETQLPDSLIQAYVGAADTPAYRGTAYVVFENMQLADYGNQMPNLEFEVVVSGNLTPLAGTYSTNTTPSGIGNPDGLSALDTLTNSTWIGANGLGSVPGGFIKINNITGESTYIPQSVIATNASPIGLVYDATDHVIWAAWYATNYVTRTDVLTNATTAFTVPTAGQVYGIALDAYSNTLWITDHYGYAEKKVWNMAKDGTLRGSVPIGEAANHILFEAETNSVWITGISHVFQIKCENYTLTTFTGLSGGGQLAFDPIGKKVWACGGTGGNNLVIDVVAGTTQLVSTGDGYAITYCADLLSMLIASYTNGGITIVNCATHSATQHFGPTPGLANISYDPLTKTAIVAKYATTWYQVVMVDYRITSTAVTLSSVVSDICVDAGLSTGGIDVTALTDTVDGYVVQRGTARSWIEPLMQAFYFDAVESDGKVKFVKRGGSVAATIAEDDLAAHVYGSAMPDNLGIDRKQEMELPVEVDVQYMDTGGAYLINTQSSRRLTTDSSNKISVNLALAMSGTKAKQIADVLMYDAWVSRSAFKLANSWKYAYLEPTDIVAVVKAGTTYTTRLIDEDTSGGIYQRAAVLEDVSIYTQNAVAAPITAPTDTVSGSPLTDLVLMDIPLLRDQDDGVGFYAAVCGYAAGWYGEQTFKSNDGGVTWNSFDRALLNSATIGSATTVMDNFSGGNIFDELNSVTVVLVNGTLSSDTEINVLNGANVALLGDEIIQFKNAALIATSTYVLTGLLRGRRGTEWAITTHAAGDRFILLTATTTYLLNGSSSEYNLARQYRGVSFGGFLDDAVTQSFTNTGASLKPLSPVQLGGGRNVALDVRLTWTRRTRVGGAWLDYIDAQLGEASEAYEVEIWTSGYVTLKRTITGISSPATTYTAAQQTTDFGSAQSTVYFKVFQVSATIGRGFEARGAA